MENLLLENSRIVLYINKYTDHTYVYIKQNMNKIEQNRKKKEIKCRN